MAITLDGTDGITTTGLISNGNAVITTQSPQLGRRNLIINGAMQVAQRGTSTGVTNAGYYGPDRYRFTVGSAGVGTYTISQDTDAPDGFGYSYKLDCTTADSSPDASDAVFIATRFEGQNLQQLKKGTASAESVTLSFWVKSNLTGTYQVNLFDIDNLRIIGSTYTVSSADTWEHKTVTFTGDTAGALTNDNGLSIQVEWALDGGTDYTSGAVPTSWEASNNADRAAGLTINIANNTANYWQITGVQLEVGDVATPFEHRSYGEEIALCQRYFVKYSSVTGEVSPFYGSSFAWVSGLSYIPFTLTTRMRAIPTLTTSGSNAVRTYAPGSSYVQTSISITSGGASVGANIIELETSGTSVSGWVRFEGQSWLAFDSEL